MADTQTVSYAVNTRNAWYITTLSSFNVARSQRGLGVDWIAVMDSAEASDATGDVDLNVIKVRIVCMGQNAVSLGRVLHSVLTDLS